MFSIEKGGFFFFVNLICTFSLFLLSVSMVKWFILKHVILKNLYQWVIISFSFSADLLYIQILISIKMKVCDIRSPTEREVAVQRWLWYAWRILRSMPRSISRRPPGITMRLEQTNAAPGTTIYWLTKGTVEKINPDIQSHPKYVIEAFQWCSNTSNIYVLLFRDSTKNKQYMTLWQYIISHCWACAE